MTSIPLRQLLPATLIFLAIQGPSLVAQHEGASYHDHWIWFAVLYAIGAALLLFGYWKVVAPAFQARWQVVLLCGLSVLFGTAFGIWYNNEHPLLQAVLEERRLSFFLDFDWRFVVVKFFDVLFQQAGLATFIFVFLQSGQKLIQTSVSLFVVFLVAHLFLLPFQGQTSVLHFVGAAILALVAPYLMARSDARIYGTFALHFLGYVVGRVVAGQWYG
jgi:hypothetical protein